MRLALNFTVEILVKMYMDSLTDLSIKIIIYYFSTRNKRKIKLC